MLRHIRLIFTALLLATSLTACSKGGGLVDSNAVRGSGIVKEETRSVSGINGASLETIGDLYITLGDKEELKIKAEDNLLPYFETLVINGVLHIQTQDNSNLQPTQPVGFYLTVTALTQVQATSMGNIHAPDLEADNLSISVSGSGDVMTGEIKATQVSLDLSSMGNLEIKKLTSDSLKADINGSGDLVIQTGEVREQSLTLSSMGSYLAGNLNSPGAKRDSSAGTIKVTVNGSGGAEMGQLTCEAASIAIHSMGCVKIKSLDASTLVVESGGSGDLEITGGRTDEQTVRLTSMGSYMAIDMETIQADVAISGSGSGTIWVNDYLKVVLSGMGDLRYAGDPTVQKVESSSGEVEHIEN